MTGVDQESYFSQHSPGSVMSRVVAAMRRSVQALHHVHPDHDDDALAATAEQLAGALGSAGTLGIRQEGALRHTRSPLSGEMSAVAPPMTSEYFPAEKKVVSRVLFNEAYQGPPACVHGGFVAALMDEALGRTRHLTERHCVTGSLKVDYRRPTPINVPLVVEARIEEIHDRKFVVRGEVMHDGLVTAQAEGIFVFLDDGKFNALSDGARAASKK